MGRERAKAPGKEASKLATDAPLRLSDTNPIVRLSGKEEASMVTDARLARDGGETALSVTATEEAVNEGGSERASSARAQSKSNADGREEARKNDEKDEEREGAENNVVVARQGYDKILETQE
eukprot:4762074-Prorocentrum_lima.AAC.1